MAEYNSSFTGKEIDERLSKAGTAMQPPATAKAGQGIAVEAVDGSGKPTIWKAVDLSKIKSIFRQDRPEEGKIVPAIAIEYFDGTINYVGIGTTEYVTIPSLSEDGELSFNYGELKFPAPVLPSVKIATKEDLEKVSAEKVSLPKDADGNPVYGTAGRPAVSDGQGGIAWEPIPDEELLQGGYTLQEEDFFRHSTWNINTETGEVWLREHPETDTVAYAYACTRKFKISRPPVIYIGSCNINDIIFMKNGAFAATVRYATYKETWTVDAEFDTVVFNITWGGTNTAEQMNVRVSVEKEKMVDPEAVHFTAQTLTDEQKAQARENIGIDKVLDYAAYGLPMLKLTGDVSAMTKDNAVNLAYEYGNLSGTASVKWQGSSSLSWEKKNYTINFDQSFEAADGWGEQTKYCFKANFIDHSHARNVVNAKLWGQIVKSRSTANATLNALPNAGAVDGFPCIIMLNGKFHGLYTWNIPKDGWMFGMNDKTLQQAILCADGGDACGFKAAATLADDFDLEYVSDENNAEWVLTSLNRLISACMNTDGTDLDTTIAQYLDWDSAIDYLIFTALLGGNDMYRKNYLLATYDGTRWFFSAYDMDTTYGLNWKGTGFNSSKGYPTLKDYNHKVMELIQTYKADVLKARYEELRKAAMSEDNLYLMFTNWASGLPSPLLLEDAKKWPTIPSTSASNTAQILNWYRLRSEVIDKEAETL